MAFDGAELVAIEGGGGPDVGLAGGVDQGIEARAALDQAGPEAAQVDGEGVVLGTAEEVLEAGEGESAAGVRQGADAITGQGPGVGQVGGGQGIAGAGA